jgi:hypothetical protein
MSLTVDLKQEQESDRAHPTPPTVPPIPGIPELQLTVQSPEGTARTVKELEHLKTITDLRKQLDESKRDQLKLIKRINQDRNTLQMHVPHEDPPSTSRSRRRSPRKLSGPKSFCDKYGKFLFFGSIAVLAAATGGYIAGSRLTNSSVTRPLIPDFSIADFNACKSQLVSTEKTLNETAQNRDAWRQNYFTLYQSLGSDAAAASALALCQLNLTDAQSDAVHYYHLWRAGTQCANATAVTNQTACTNSTELEMHLAQLNKTLTLVKLNLDDCETQFGLSEAQLNASQTALDVCASDKATCQVALLAADDIGGQLRANLTEAQTVLSTCATHNGACQVALANATATAAQLQTNLTAANGQLAAAQSSLSTCQADQNACQVALVASNNNGAQLQANLTAAQGTASACAADKAACQLALQTTNATLQAAFADEDEMEDEIAGLKVNVTAARRALNQSQWDLGHCQTTLAHTQDALSSTQAQYNSVKPCYNSLWGIVNGLLNWLLPSGCPASL